MAPLHPRASIRADDARADSGPGEAITSHSAFAVTSDPGTGDPAARTLSEPRSFLLTSILDL